MNQIDVKTLLEKYRKGMATEQEQLLLENWYAIESVNQMQQPELEDYLRIKKEMWAMMEREMLSASPERQGTDSIVTDRKLNRLWPRIAVAAAAVTVITLGVWFYYTSSISGSSSRGIEGSLVYATDITPGKNTATLTLASGQVIYLSDTKTGVVIDASKLTYSDGTAISSPLRDPSLSSQGTEGPLGHADSRDPSAVGMTSVSTPRGGQYQVVLPDGSKVWLNAASSLSFPASFRGEKQRVVQLEGEAYFEIFKSRTQKFVVESKGQTVEVLGTHFNINSYADEGSVKTTLLEGSVSVSALSTVASSLQEGIPGSSSSRGTEGSLGSKVLRPGQQSVLTANRNILVKEIDGEEAVDWKNGLFIFNKEPLERIMRKISRWYDVDVVFENEELKSKLFGGTVSRSGNVTEVLEILELTELAHFKIVGRRIMVTK